MSEEHKEGECSSSDCQICCEHDFDPREHYTCLNCGALGDPGDDAQDED